MKDVMTDEDARNLEAWARACLGAGTGWKWGDCAPEGGFATIDDVVADTAAFIRNAAPSGETVPEHALHAWCVHVDAGDGESLIVALTGNGPTSREHARFLAAAPRAVLSLLDERARLLARLRASEPSR